jgi:hypothetical protein
VNVGAAAAASPTVSAAMASTALMAIASTRPRAHRLAPVVVIVPTFLVPPALGLRRVRSCTNLT